MPVEITDVAGDERSQAESTAINVQIEAITRKYEPRIAALQAEAAKLKEDAPDPGTVEAILNVDFDVTWSTQSIVFDYPEVSLRDKRIAFDLPEVRMDTQRIVFDVPAVRMKTRVVGRKPEFHGFTVKWTDIIISVPEVYMQRHEIKTDIPSVTMKRMEIVVGLPQFEMKRVKWAISLPQFKVKKISAATAKLDAKGRELQSEGEAIGMAMNAEINQLLGNTMSGTGVSSMVEAARQAFDNALTSVKSSIDNLSQKGIDPIKVPAEGGNLNLRKQLEDVISTRDTVLPKLESVAAEVLAKAKASATVVKE